MPYISDDEIIHDVVLAHEGSAFTNDPKDVGGPTKFGITLATLSAWRKVPCTASDVERLTVEEAVSIYREKYIAQPGFGRIADMNLRAALVDMAVLFGQAEAIMTLQSVLELHVDGVVGGKTVDAANSAEARHVINAIAVVRIRKHASRVVARPDQLRFLLGWLNRATSFIT